MTPTLTRTMAASAAVLVIAALAGCSQAENTGGTGTEADQPPNATDAFPVTIEHAFGEVTIPAQPENVVVVGLTEQDILLELGVTPVATTEWYGEQPYATWPWATELLGDAQPEVLSTTDGFEYGKIAALRPDLIVGMNAGIDQDAYDKLSSIAPTIAHLEGAEAYFSDWQDQTRTIATALGMTQEGEALVASVEDAYAEVAAAHPQWEGMTATFAQGDVSSGTVWAYPDGLNTDFLTDLGFTITPGLEEHAPDGYQAQISAENLDLLEADVVVFTTDYEGALEDLLDFGTMSTLPAVAENRAVYTDPVLAGAIYFLTPLSQKYVLTELIPRLELAAEGQAPRDMLG